MSTSNRRLKRAKRSRVKMAELNVTRLTIYRSNSNIYAQIIDGENNNVIATASTTEAAVKKSLKNTSNKEAAIAIGKELQKKLLKQELKRLHLIDLDINIMDVLRL